MERKYEKMHPYLGIKNKNLVLDLAITDCFFVFHEIVEDPRIVHKLVVDFLVEGQLAESLSL